MSCSDDYQVRLDDVPGLDYGPVASGTLVLLRTTIELQGRDSLGQVYVTKIPVRVANEILIVLRPLIEASAIDLQHLRRFAKLDDLPQHLRILFSGCPTKEQVKPVTKDLYFLIGRTSSIDLVKLKKALSGVLENVPVEQLLVHAISVPLLGPTSQEQAISWTNSHWPTVYKKSNPFGPHPSIVQRAENELLRDVHIWMNMAGKVAARVKTEGYGEAIGAVVVNRNNTISHAVALAGDARWKDDKGAVVSNVMTHAVLRAIGMVAQKLKSDDETECTALHDPIIAQGSKMLLEYPLVSEERAVFDSGHIAPDGYLCDGLEIYLTHEPCVMCSMALLHSRFSRVVFAEKMPRTGGLCSEVSTCTSSAATAGLGLGLFWRKELNWRFLSWRYKFIEPKVSMIVDPTIHA